jgi:hypothetical protein
MGKEAEWAPELIWMWRGGEKSQLLLGIKCHQVHSLITIVTELPWLFRENTDPFIK